MPKHYGYEWEVSTYAYFKVAMAKTEDADEIDEESFDATCRLYEGRSDVKVIDNRVMEVSQDNKYFTVADVGLDLRIKLTAHNLDDAFDEAERMAEEIKSELPPGVVWFDCESYDAEKGDEAIDWDVA